jgi:hypothetical protein
LGEKNHEHFIATRELFHHGKFVTGKRPSMKPPALLVQIAEHKDK